MHSLWVDCKNNALSAANCRTVRPYQAPGNSAALPNRYCFVLFQQQGPAKVDPTAPGFKFGSRYSVGQLLSDNPGMAGVAWNFVLVNGEGSSAKAKSRPGKKAKKLLRRRRR